MGHDNQAKTAANATPPVEKFLGQKDGSPIPAPKRDLVARTIRRIQHWMVLGDLLRFVTLEYHWKAVGRHRDAANNPDDSEKS